MCKMKIHVFHTGEVCVSKDLPFGGEHCSAIRASGIFQNKEERLWLPVSAYLIESKYGLVLFDCGWHREMSPEGQYDKKAQIRSLGSWALYKTNQGRIEKGQAIHEQLASMNIKTSDIDLVLLSHLDCDHANGLKLVSDAKQILVSNEELKFANQKNPMNRIRYNENWWKDTKIKGFDWNDSKGPVSKSYDVFGDGCMQMINIPGHSDGQCALKITNEEGKYVLLFADGGYATKSWKEMIPSGIAADKTKQIQSLQWIRQESLNENCVESLANHDMDIRPHVILL